MDQNENLELIHDELRYALNIWFISRSVYLVISRINVFQTQYYAVIVMV